VDAPHDVRSGGVEDLVAPLQPGEVVEREVVRLEHGAHRTVGDHHALGQRLQERGVEPSIRAVI
jgi:hypothetical protein